MKKIFQLNGESRAFESITTLSQLLAILQLPERGVAVAVNGTIIPRSTHADFLLTGNERIEIVRAVAGG